MNAEQLQRIHLDVISLNGLLEVLRLAAINSCCPQTRRVEAKEAPADTL